MNIQTLTELQRCALLDLLMLGIYTDGHIAAIEDAAIRKLLEEMGIDAASDRDRELDAAATRVRQHIASAESAQKYAKSLALAFSARDQRRQVQERLKSLLTIDNKFTVAEKSYAALVDEALRI